MLIVLPRWLYQPRRITDKQNVSHGFRLPESSVSRWQVHFHDGAVVSRGNAALLHCGWQKNAVSSRHFHDFCTKVQNCVTFWNRYNVKLVVSGYFSIALFKQIQVELFTPDNCLPSFPITVTGNCVYRSTVKIGYFQSLLNGSVRELPLASVRFQSNSRKVVSLDCWISATRSPAPNA